MAPAVKPLRAALDEVAGRMQPPRADVYMNCTGKPVYAGTSPKVLIPMLLRQLTQPVLWESSIKEMLQAGVCDFVEVGPMQQLKAIMKRIEPMAHARTINVEV